MENVKRLEQELQFITKSDGIVKLSTALETSCRLTDISKHETNVLRSEEACDNMSKSYRSNYFEEFQSLPKYYDSDSSSSSPFNAPMIRSQVEDNSRRFNISCINGSSRDWHVRKQTYFNKYRPRNFAKTDVDDFGAYKGFYDANGRYDVCGTRLLSKSLRDMDFPMRICRNYTESLKFLKKHEYFKYRKMHKIITSLSYSYKQKKYFGKWKRPFVPKKQLDDELDTYMSEAKIQYQTNKMESECFLDEYMSETEKCLNQNDPLNVFD